jgi:hypothetical protein
LTVVFQQVFCAKKAKKNQQLTNGLAVWWLDIGNINFYSLSASVPAEVILLNFWLVTFTFLYLFISISGLTFFKCHHNAKPRNVARHFMTPLFRIFTLTITLTLPIIFTFGQYNSKKVLQRPLKVETIDKICKAIDENKNLVEAIKEGETLSKKGGFDIYYLMDKFRTLYRVTYSFSTDKYQKRIFYYYRKKLIRATLTNVDNDLTKPKYLMTYYFDNNRLIKTKEENKSYSNFKNILKQALDFEKDFYSDKRE